MSSLYKIRTDKRLDPERKKKNVARQKTELRRARSVSFFFFFFWAGDLDHRQTRNNFSIVILIYTLLGTCTYIDMYIHALLLLISGQNQFFLFLYIYFSISISMLLCM